MCKERRIVDKENMRGLCEKDGIMSGDGDGWLKGKKATGAFLLSLSRMEFAPLGSLAHPIGAPNHMISPHGIPTAKPIPIYI